MWFVFTFFLVLWIISIQYFFPVIFILALFAAMMITAGLALIPGEALE
ncbi:MAG: hypothetical protein ACR2IF_11190 [Terriglobales bacterium]